MTSSLPPFGRAAEIVPESISTRDKTRIPPQIRASFQKEWDKAQIRLHDQAWGRDGETRDRQIEPIRENDFRECLFGQCMYPVGKYPNLGPLCRKIIDA